VGSRACLSACSLAGPTRTDFVSNPTAICVGGTFQFTDQTLGGPTSWDWTFPGGTPTTSTLRNPTVSFATAGTKSITLTTNNGAGPTSKSRSFLVAATPAVACTNTGTSTSNAGINSVSLNTISNTTGGAAADGNKYLDFSCTKTSNLEANTTYSVSVNVGTTNPTNQFNLVQLFIDYNNDGDFVDANEAVYSSPSCYIGTHTFSFTTPAVIPVTNTLLRTRIIAKDCFGGVNACYNVTDGQVEDYAVSFFTVLPLRLLSFKGSHRSGINTLIWNTTEEVNTKHFEIERSSNSTDFIFAGRMPVNTNSPSNVYKFEDDVKFAAANSIFYYRLKMVDTDGRFTYSNVVMLKSEGGSDISFYPNPVKRGQQIKINRGGNTITSVEIINSIGQIILTKKADTQNSIITIDTQISWPSGTYILRLKGVQQTYNETIIIL
jgi:PKD repeat protein